MGYQCFAWHGVVPLAQVHQPESGTPVQLASVTVTPREPFRAGGHQAGKALERAMAKILEVAAGASDRDHRVTVCFYSAEYRSRGRKELASA